MGQDLSNLDIVEFARIVLGIKLYPGQEEVLRRLERGEEVVFMTRRISKSTLWLIWDEYKKLKDEHERGEGARRSSLGQRRPS